MTLEQVARTSLFIPSPLPTPPTITPSIPSPATRYKELKAGTANVREAVSSKDLEPPPEAQKAAFYKALPNSLWEVSPVHTRR